MTTSARDVLTQFESLDNRERLEVAAEILRRYTGTGELPKSALDELADELFVGYDAEESAHAAD